MEIEKGKWYHADGILIYVNKLYGDAVFGYGLNSEEGFWIKEDDDPWYVMQITHEATPQEVESALIEEAKRRGCKFDKYVYDDELNILWGSEGDLLSSIFCKGKWVGLDVEQDPYNWVNNSMKEDKPQMFSGGMNKDNREDEEILRRAKEGVSDFYTITESIADLLVYKNAKYGNAVLEPLQIFSGKCKAGTRLDDKLGRIKNSSELRKNDVADLIGYLILTCKENNWTDFSEFQD